MPLNGVDEELEDIFNPRLRNEGGSATQLPPFVTSETRVPGGTIFDVGIISQDYGGGPGVIGSRAGGTGAASMGGGITRRVAEPLPGDDIFARIYNAELQRRNEARAAKGELPIAIYDAQELSQLADWAARQVEIEFKNQDIDAARQARANAATSGGQLGVPAIFPIPGLDPTSGLILTGIGLLGSGGRIGTIDPNNPGTILGAGAGAIQSGVNVATGNLPDFNPGLTPPTTNTNINFGGTGSAAGAGTPSAAGGTTPSSGSTSAAGGNAPGQNTGPTQWTTISGGNAPVNPNTSPALGQSNIQVPQGILTPNQPGPVGVPQGVLRPNVPEAVIIGAGVLGQNNQRTQQPGTTTPSPSTSTSTTTTGSTSTGTGSQTQGANQGNVGSGATIGTGGRIGGPENTGGGVVTGGGTVGTGTGSTGGTTGGSTGRVGGGGGGESNIPGAGVAVGGGGGGGGGGSTSTGGTTGMPVITGPYNFATPAAGSLILRDYGKEFGTTSAALQAQAQPILNLYQDILTRYTPATMTQFAGTAQQRLGADLAALQAAEQGQLSAEDVRRAQQSAREAYGARGMLFSPGAVGAEILNRQAIQDAREAEARANYQQSIQNVANAAQLQTGNIFQPVASLLSQTFSPTSQYANAVYDYNVNAYNAYVVAQENMAAYKEAARQGQQDQFLASFGNFLLRNGIKTTADQLSGIFQGILNIGGSNTGTGTGAGTGTTVPTQNRPP